MRSAILKLLARIYQWVISPVIHTLAGPSAGCRFEPTCSHYASDAIEVHGWIRGGALAIKRILKCHPWGEMGFDPVPSESKK
jgi:putative membrane protein insertion efficiency factor